MYVAQCFSPCFIFNPALTGSFRKSDYMLDSQECQVALLLFLNIRSHSPVTVYSSIDEPPWVALC